MKNLFLTLFVLLNMTLVSTGCGYKPASYYAKGAIEGKVFVDVNLDIQNSHNAMYIKDEINKMVLNRFHALLTPNKDEADSVILVNLRSITDTALETDNSGYVKTYRTTVKASISYKTADKPFKTLSVSDYHDYTVDSSSVVTTAKRNEAVKIASMKAISDLFSKMAVKNIKN